MNHQHRTSVDVLLRLHVLKCLINGRVDGRQINAVQLRGNLNLITQGPRCSQRRGCLRVKRGVKLRAQYFGRNIFEQRAAQMGAIQRLHGQAVGSATDQIIIKRKGHTRRSRVGQLRTQHLLLRAGTHQHRGAQTFDCTAQRNFCFHQCLCVQRSICDRLTDIQCRYGRNVLSGGIRRGGIDRRVRTGRQRCQSNGQHERSFGGWHCLPVMCCFVHVPPR